MIRRRFIPLLILGALLLAVAVGCAKQGYPSGGPVDRTPPKVLGTTPHNATANFTAKEFSLQVDEYVTIKDADNNILVSPPLKQKPECAVRGHKVVVHIKDTLQENTTYLFQFKGAIVDFNEGNPLQSFEYVFSTGDNIDSMTLQGRVVDALTLKASKEVVSVLAYSETVSDSAVALEQPMYYTRCDTGGHFAFNHIAAGRYRLVALVDGDRNLRLNPGEAMAFLDSAVTAMPMPQPQDSTTPTQEEYEMRLSLRVVEQQRVTESKTLGTGHFRIVTKTPLTDHYTVDHLMSDNTLELHIHRNTHGDTLDIWTAPQPKDSIVLLLHDDTTLNDTLTFRSNNKLNSQLTPLSSQLSPLKVQSLMARDHPYYDTLRLQMETPVAVIDTSMSLQVMNLKDSTISLHKAYLKGSSVQSPRSNSSLDAWIDFPGTAGGNYQITLPAGMMTDIYGRKNDSLVITTTYTKPENYGSISLTVETQRIAPQGNLLVQLLNEKGDVMRQTSLSAPGTATFPHLKAGKYKFRLVNDTHGDGQWTPGDYWTKQQPDEVIYLDKVLDLRENWEINEQFHW